MATSGQGVLRRLLVVFEFGADVSQVDKAKKKMGDLVGDMKKVAAGLAGGAIAKGIAGFVKDTVDEMMAIKRGAAELRITTDEMQGLQIAAKATGSDAKWLAMSMERLQVNMERASRGAKNQSMAVHMLGLSAKDANGKTKSATELYLETADAISKMTDQNKQAIVVRDLFGIGGHRQLPILRMGRKAIEDLMNITKEYGSYTEQAIDESSKYTITLLKLEGVFRGIKSFIMTQWLPILDEQTTWLIKAGKWLMTMMKNSLLAKAALQVLQVAMAGLALKMAFAYPWAVLLMGALVGITAVWDDILVLFAGGHSLIGDLLDKMFGVGTSTATVEKLRDLWRDISQFAALAWGSAKNLLGIKDTAPDTTPRWGVSSPSVMDPIDAMNKRNEARRGAKPATPSIAGDDPSKMGPLTRLWHSADIAGIPGKIYKGATEDLPNAVGRMAAGDWEEHHSIGELHITVTPPAGTDAEGQARLIAEAVVKEQNKAAAAALRRERHP